MKNNTVMTSRQFVHRFPRARSAHYGSPCWRSLSEPLTSALEFATDYYDGGPGVAETRAVTVLQLNRFESCGLTSTSRYPSFWGATPLPIWPRGVMSCSIHGQGPDVDNNASSCDGEALDSGRPSGCDRAKSTREATRSCGCDATLQVMGNVGALATALGFLTSVFQRVRVHALEWANRSTDVRDGRTQPV